MTVIVLVIIGIIIGSRLHYRIVNAMYARQQERLYNYITEHGQVLLKNATEKLSGVQRIAVNSSTGASSFESAYYAPWDEWESIDYNRRQYVVTADFVIYYDDTFDKLQGDDLSRNFDEYAGTNHLMKILHEEFILKVEKECKAPLFTKHVNMPVLFNKRIVASYYPEIRQIRTQRFTYFWDGNGGGVRVINNATGEEIDEKTRDKLIGNTSS